jgi:hypothetical protein
VLEMKARPGEKHQFERDYSREDNVHILGERWIFESRINYNLEKSEKIFAYHYRMYYKYNSVAWGPHIVG